MATTTAEQAFGKAVRGLWCGKRHGPSSKPPPRADIEKLTEAACGLPKSAAMRIVLDCVRTQPCVAPLCLLDSMVKAKGHGRGFRRAADAVEVAVAVEALLNQVGWGGGLGPGDRGLEMYRCVF